MPAIYISVNLCRFVVGFGVFEGSHPDTRRRCRAFVVYFLWFGLEFYFE